MATIKLNWTDQADNETEFKVYKGATPTLTNQSEEVCQLVYNGSNWTLQTSNNSISNMSLLSTNGSQALDNERFRIEFEDSSTGLTYYGVSASNGAGESDVVPISEGLNI